MMVAAREASLGPIHLGRLTVDAGRVPDGRTSYQVLSDVVAGQRRVLDLGCGDGHLLDLLAHAHPRRLAGTDPAAEPLSVARQRPALAGAALAVACPSALPFPDDSFDACVSHLALAQLSDLDRVAAELARVLAPEGVLAVVLPGGAVPGTAYEVFNDLTRSVLEEVPVDRRQPELGDRRARHRAGLEQVLGGAGFGQVDWRAIRLDLTGGLDQVWARLVEIYDLGPLDPAALATLRRCFDSTVTVLPDGRVPCAMNLHLAVAFAPNGFTA
ncbi:class I SAM-dependent methyltransferase [Crossiella sp. CA-258035]|uniref:class I SAM-dependent methyltransferase n=1 Tax=Crossiella sp. CA-258035 TaxID=2981138 RepID=UPI0024BCF814|nr:class I SAM-dependent methyltransferase [Crossiella sp. CA-258035]WHT16715.1 class I SAM-dependent methyltransferase [Crossiella sp. CA-258035]